VSTGWDIDVLRVPGPDLGVRRPADARVLVLTMAAGVAFDLAVRSGVAGVGGALAALVAAVALLSTGRVESRQATIVVGLTPVLAVWLALRTSPWLLAFDMAAAGALLLTGAALGSRSVWDMTVPATLERAWLTVLHMLSAPAFLGRSLRDRFGRRSESRSVAPWVRGLALALPVVVVVGALLASADAIFASLLVPDVGLGSLTIHGVLVVMGAWGWAGLARTASGVESTPGSRPRLSVAIGAVEAAVVLALLAIVLAAFSAVQLVAAAGGARHVLETRGLTYAEYARSGFFQLLAVAAIVLIAVVALRAATDSRDRRFVVAAELVGALTLVVVAVAVRRLALYDDAFGLTVLRLLATVGAAWTGVVFVMLMAWLAGAGAGRHWFPGGVAVAGLVTLFVLNLANPEAFVARHDVDHALASGRVDSDYLAGLSDDAVPTLLRRAARLPADQAAALRTAVCAGGAADTFKGWAAANRSKGRADNARREFCRRDEGVAPRRYH
jgi:uncharacterized protein DUF4153